MRPGPRWTAMTLEALVAALGRRDFPAARRVLADEPAVARARGSGLSPLLLALYMRADDVVKDLLEKGADPDVHEAAALGDAGRLRALVGEDKGRLAAMSSDGWSALHLAAHFDRADAVRALLSMGADVRARSANANGNTPLHAAAAGGAAEAARLLVAAGAEVGATDALGWAPLHIAAAGARADVVRVLLAKGADRRQTGPEGKTAAQVATERGHDDVAALLA